MPCDVNTSQPVLGFLRRSWRMCGNTTNPLEGQAADDALYFLNSTLERLGSLPQGITFLTEVSFIGTSSLEYKIGLSAETTPDIVNQKQMTYIRSAKSTLGKVDEPMEFIPQSSYNNITFKYPGGWPEFYTYFMGKDYTTVRIYPAPTSAYTITFQGLQRLDLESYFTSISRIPPQNLLYLQYEIASLLIDAKYGTPTAEFYTNYEKLKMAFEEANQDDYTQINGTPTPNLKSGSTWIGAGGQFIAVGGY